MQKVILSFLIILFPIFAQAQKTPTIDPIKEEKKDELNLTSHLPSYFLYHYDVSKLQASFKYKPVRKQQFYLGYTHLIFWELNKESKPIYDVNYNPEFFYRFEVNQENLQSIDLIAYGHKSNGKEGIDSRSFDYSAIQFNTQYKIKNYLIRSELRLRASHNFDDPNADLIEYQGPVEVNISASQFSKGTIDKAELALRVFSGGRYGQYLGRGGQELSLSFRLMGLDISPSFLIQYYHGYNEFLRNYNKEENILRFGFLL